jgi:hypothetical protein
MRSKAVQDLRKGLLTASRHRRPGLDFLVLALSGKRALTQGTFDKVVKMIDTMVAELKKEQQDDADKKEYCSVQLDTTDDKKRHSSVQFPTSKERLQRRRNLSQP